MPTTPHHGRPDPPAVTGGLASARRWQAEAAALREHAQATRLSPTQRASLLRGAVAADRQAEFWLEGCRQDAGRAAGTAGLRR
ncbi:hypothetical protein HVIM_04544 (plasmid) [Roseomonas mucosa]|jgi:hypothetical protein|uniref:Uncharacterized protein n=2 Tax=Roseomonas TaxID=125216 RepID=A0A379PNQ1_9PROT|nr:hypothetical protein [Roseomonas mucosa]QDD92715.1 hypothetical protein HVIM_04544 [Roseomonas mucosa]QDD97234.1 hypothetical protein ADP8_04544b [Roseomonas mucosa]QET91582.1 hypothetical protein FOB66_01295 [Roseomonas mucosa]USQ74465.1 hypothetical protein NF552_24400 [Roseomonas mucosa]SUE95666.1 Uncharacterised protein [Roseomonas mucosa]